MGESHTAAERDLVRAVPWGRSFEEYRAMFDLGVGAVGGRPFARAGERPRVLDVGGGPASFTAEAFGRGWEVVACDPLYGRDGAAIETSVMGARDRVMALVRAEPERFIWTSIDSPEALERLRLAALEAFLADYDAGRAAGRYRPDGLPALPFENGRFDLALCSHLLFLYSESLDADFHLAAIREMARVAREVRIFPLLDMAGRRSPHLEPVLAGLTESGHRAALLPVPYEFQRGGTEMLRVVGPDTVEVS